MSAKHTPGMLSTHRLLQIAELNDRAPSERVAFYCRAIKAAHIGNNSAARFFTQKAQKWELIRARTEVRLSLDRAAIAKAAGSTA